MILQSFLADRQFAKAVFVAGLLAFAAQASAGDLSLPLPGNLLGTVVDAAGDPQMGARVELLNKYDRIVSKTLSSIDGRFAFAGLVSDAYSIRVSLNSFLPAFRDKILVKAGTDSFLQIHLSTLFSSIQLNSTVPTGGMNSDWKWVLRTAPSTRPITRFLPDDTVVARNRSQVFSDTHMMVGVSGGPSGLLDSESGVSDLGTSFAVSTNLFGKNQIQVAGSLGQGLDLSGSAFGLSAIFSRDSSLGFANAPEITLTLSQVSLFGTPTAAAGLFAPQQSSTAGILRTMSMSVYQVADPADNIHVEYGMSAESVDYLQHSARISPFARISVDAGTLGTLTGSFSDGGRPDELTAHQISPELNAPGVPHEDLENALNAMARVPQVSTRLGRLELQRTEDLELGLHKTVGSRTYAVSAFYEQVSNGRLNVAGDLSSLGSGDVLSDGISQTSAYNIGHYNRNGYMASVTQKISDSFDLELGYGRLGGFTARQTGITYGAAPSSFLQSQNRNLVTAGINTRIAKSGTRLSAQYGWTDDRALIPQHTFTTQATYASAGLNFYLRQPLPSLFGLPGRLELTGDLRNLLSDGYLPLMNGDGRRLLIVQSPKVIRGGVSFTF